MKITHEGIIIDVWTRNVNGEGTSVELVLDYNTIEKDTDGEFESFRSINIPFETQLRTVNHLPDLEGKKVRITIEILE